MGEAMEQFFKLAPFSPASVWSVCNFQPPCGLWAKRNFLNTSLPFVFIDFFTTWIAQIRAKIFSTQKDFLNILWKFTIIGK
jgi:hypothetical protein